MFTSLFQLEQKPVTVFRSSDANAPNLQAVAGSLKTLLKACLVTGYGDKQGLGWQMPFESTDKNSAVFVSSDVASSKYCFKIDNTSATTAKLSAYQSMTDINTGINPFVVDNLYKLYASNWVLIGHSRAFILLLDVDLNYTRFAYPIIFGDLPREKKRANAVCVLWSGRDNSSYQAGLQNILFRLVNGSTTAYNTYDNSTGYPVVVADGNKSFNLQNNVCRFKHDTFITAQALFEPVLSQLPDATWTFIPMLQPISTKVSDVSNLGVMSNNTIKVATGSYRQANYDNTDCAVPTDWWWA